MGGGEDKRTVSKFNPDNENWTGPDLNDLTVDKWETEYFDKLDEKDRVANAFYRIKNSYDQISSESFKKYNITQEKSQGLYFTIGNSLISNTITKSHDSSRIFERSSAAAMYAFLVCTYEIMPQNGIIDQDELDIREMKNDEVRFNNKLDKILRKSINYITAHNYVVHSARELYKKREPTAAAKAAAAEKAAAEKAAAEKAAAEKAAAEKAAAEKAAAEKAAAEKAAAEKAAAEKAAAEKAAAEKAAAEKAAAEKAAAEKAAAEKAAAEKAAAEKAAAEKAAAEKAAAEKAAAEKAATEKAAAATSLQCAFRIRFAHRKRARLAAAAVEKAAEEQEEEEEEAEVAAKVEAVAKEEEEEEDEEEDEDEDEDEDEEDEEEDEDEEAAAKEAAETVSPTSVLSPPSSQKAIGQTLLQDAWVYMWQYKDSHDYKGLTKIGFTTEKDPKIRLRKHQYNNPTCELELMHLFHMPGGGIVEKMFFKAAQECSIQFEPKTIVHTSKCEWITDLQKGVEILRTIESQIHPNEWIIDPAIDWSTKSNDYGEL